MEILAGSAIVAGALVFLLGTVWLTLAIHRSRRRRTPAMIAVLGLVATNAGGILYLQGYVAAYPGYLYPVIYAITLLMVLGVLGLLVGMAWAALSLLRRRGVYAPVVLAGLAIVAFFQASVLIIEQPFPRRVDVAKEVEWAALQTAMDILMADQKIKQVEPSPANTAQNDYSALPKYTLEDGSPGTTFLGGTYLRDYTSFYFYCWDESGAITRQDKDSPRQCP